MRSDRDIENDQIKKPEGHTCKKMQKEDLLLYAVTDRHWLNGETLYSQVEKALEGGTTFVQLREKELDEVHFLEEAKKIIENYFAMVDGKEYDPELLDEAVIMKGVYKQPNRIKCATTGWHAMEQMIEESEEK